MVAGQPFPEYSVIPPGAAYAGAAADYGKTHIHDRSTASEDTPDQGLTVFSPETLTKGGLVRVAKDRVKAGEVAEPTVDALSKGARPPVKDEPGVQIWYEVHGKGPQKIVLIMGLNNSGFGWLSQVETFARDERYSVLVLDNRGYGNSETPTNIKAAYKTSEMAKDVLEVCDHLGWTSDRQLHITGVSMGGMISLEVAKQAPQRVASLSLLSTTSGASKGQKGLTSGLPPLAAVRMIVRLLGGKTLGLDSDQYRVQRVVETLFPKEWLDQKDDKDPQGRTHRETIFEIFVWRFHFVRQQHPTGSLGQIRAVTTHHVSNKELLSIDGAVPSILIVTGDEDNLVKPVNSIHLKKWLPSARLEQLKGRGHAIQLQDPDLLNGLLGDNYKAGWEKSADQRSSETVETEAAETGDDLPSSKLGTKEHWDNVYEREVANFAEHGDRGEVWFGQESAQVMLEYLRKEYPSVSASASSSGPSILDLGTGNGHLLFSLCGVRDEDEDDDDDEEDGGFIASPDRMCGVDYSPASIQLCKEIARSAEAPAGVDVGKIQWKVLDALDPSSVASAGQYDILLDKGTLDAIALASSQAGEGGNGAIATPLEKYISNLAPLSVPSKDTLLLITSCNFTAQELITRVQTASKGAWKHHETLPPKREFSFGGKKGSTTCCVAFKRT
ncbi:unnamed protein product [Parajaminaea phylloscopi]